MDCIIATIPRNGSSWLCELLENNGFVAPREHFNPWLGRPFGRALAEGVPTEDYLRALRERESTPGLATKLMFEWLVRMQANLRTPSLEPHRMMQRLFPGARWIFLTRRDRIAGAISYARALSSGRWAEYEERAEIDEGAPTTPTSEEVHRWLLWRVESEHHWRCFFRSGGIEPLELTYEALAEDPAAALSRIFRHCDLAAPERVRLDSRIRVQADDTSAVIRRDYLKSFAAREDR